MWEHLARKLHAKGATSVNGEKVTVEQQQLGFAFYDQYWLIQSGKNTLHYQKTTKNLTLDTN